MAMESRRCTRPWYILENATVYTDSVQAMLVIGTDATTSAVAAYDLFIEYDCELAQGQSTTAPEWFAPLRDLVRDRVVAKRIYEALLALGYLRPKQEQVEVQTTSTASVSTDVGEKSLDVLAGAAAKYGELWDVLKRRLNDLPREQQLELLSTLASRT